VEASETGAISCVVREQDANMSEIDGRVTASRADGEWSPGDRVCIQVPFPFRINDDAEFYYGCYFLS